MERNKSWTPVADPRRLAPGPGSLSWQGFEKTTHCTEDGEGNYGSIKKTGEFKSFFGDYPKGDLSKMFVRRGREKAESKGSLHQPGNPAPHPPSSPTC